MRRRVKGILMSGMFNLKKERNVIYRQRFMYLFRNHMLKCVYRPGTRGDPFSILFMYYNRGEDEESMKTMRRKKNQSRTRLPQIMSEDNQN